MILLYISNLREIQPGKLIRRFLDMDDSLFFSFLAFGEKKFHEIRLGAFVWAGFFALFDDFLVAIGLGDIYRAATFEDV
jgi:hypothetical protein